MPVRTIHHGAETLNRCSQMAGQHSALCDVHGLSLPDIYFQRVGKEVVVGWEWQLDVILQHLIHSGCSGVGPNNCQYNIMLSVTLFCIRLPIPWDFWIFIDRFVPDHYCWTSNVCDDLMHRYVRPNANEHGGFIDLEEGSWIVEHGNTVLPQKLFVKRAVNGILGKASDGIRCDSFARGAES